MNRGSPAHSCSRQVGVRLCPGHPLHLHSTLCPPLLVQLCARFPQRERQAEPWFQSPMETVQDDKEVNNTPAAPVNFEVKILVWPQPGGPGAHGEKRHVAAPGLCQIRPRPVDSSLKPPPVQASVGPQPPACAPAPHSPEPDWRGPRHTDKAEAPRPTSRPEAWWTSCRTALCPMVMGWISEAHPAGTRP